MNLKEAYRYMNFLERLSIEANTLLRDRSFVTTTTIQHFCSKSNASAEDKTEVLPKVRDVEYAPNDVLDFVVKIMEQRELLSSAIVAAKKKTAIDTDHSCSMNKHRQALIATLQRMNDYKATKKPSRATGYKFDAEGKQVPYIYETTEEQSIDFDRKDVKGLIKKYSDQCDTISTMLDKIDIDTDVDYTPIWDINDTFEDAILA